MKIVRSNRKTFTLQIKPREGLIVRVPIQATQEQVKKFMNDHRGWIEKHLKAMEERQKEASSVEKLSMDEIRDLADQALKLIPERVRFFNSLTKINYSAVKEIYILLRLDSTLCAFITFTKRSNSIKPSGS